MNYSILIYCYVFFLFALAPFRVFAHSDRHNIDVSVELQAFENRVKVKPCLLTVSSTQYSYEISVQRVGVAGTSRSSYQGEFKANQQQCAKAAPMISFSTSDAASIVLRVFDHEDELVHEESLTYPESTKFQ